MSETPTDPADVHTGTDRVELTDDLSRLREVVVEVAANALRQEGTHYNSILHADKVARLAIEAALPSLIKRVETAEAQLRTEGWLDAHGACMEIERRLAADRDAARAELAAANARYAELEAENEAKHEAVWGLIAQVADQHVAPDLGDDPDGDLDEQVEIVLNRRARQMLDDLRSENATLQATLDRVAAFIETWSQPHSCAKNNTAQCVPCRMLRDLRAALTPEGTE